MTQKEHIFPQEVSIRSGSILLGGDMIIPRSAPGIVLFAHGSGSGRNNFPNQFIAGSIQNAGIGTLLFDLLTSEEQSTDTHTGYLQFDVDLLAQRLIDATNWLLTEEVCRMRVGYFGSGTGAAAALIAASYFGDSIGAVALCSGRLDLAGTNLSPVTAPTLLIEGGLDDAAIRHDQPALEQLKCRKAFQIILDATHLFEDPGALQQVARCAADWFHEHL